jgi:ORF6N domain
MFRLSKEELEFWRSQVVMSNVNAKMSLRRAPYAFTEHGAYMAGNVLRSKRAIEVSIFVVRAFVQLRDLLSTHKTLARQLADLEKRVGGHDKAIAQIVADIHRLLETPPEPKKRSIGFHTPDDD